ncbi:hypothetical protein BJY00DRAFT_308400 [Aspergillus carlsbadensis]|nr:hypothetical protein BJY00DRAFT_308400 [Aspergillus carlsbadensis]
MPKLLTIPIELHRLILEECNLATCRSPVSTSRSLRPVATECLYRTIDGYIGEAAGSWSCRHVQLFLRSVIENPPLASLVSAVDLDVDYYPGDDMRGTGYLKGIKFGDADTAIHEQAMGLLQRMQVGGLESWCEDLKSGSLDPWIALLISQLRCLQDLTLKLHVLHKSRYLGRVLMHLARPGLGYFTRLRSVKFGENRFTFQMVGLDISDEIVMPLLHLPALESLDLTLHMPCIATWPTKGLLPSLKSLTLSQWNVTVEDVDALLRLTPNLRELWCGFVREEREDRPDSDLIDFGKLLNSSDLTATPVGLSLPDFDALRHLDVPFDFLAGGQPPHTDVDLGRVLPTGLRTLWGHRSLVNYVNLLPRFLRERQANTPFLNHILINLTRGPAYDGVGLDAISAAEGTYPPEAVQLVALALGTGVTFVVQYGVDFDSELFRVSGRRGVDVDGDEGTADLPAAITRALAYFRAPLIGDC